MHRASTTDTSTTPSAQPGLPDRITVNGAMVDQVSVVALTSRAGVARLRQDSTAEDGAVVDSMVAALADTLGVKDRLI